ncbi:unnamed protein product [Phytomonas sp. Hart1]|nr:unnamed protein product [Phytomonas sp. Hart1]|eukprot:CCW68459.1 unnamed protein product [Phytomonas sp. isolate Hart1]
MGSPCHLTSSPPCLFLRSHIETNGYITIIAESFRANYTHVQRMLATLAEPVSRPPLIHEYHLTPFSLGAAVSNGLSSDEAMNFMQANVYDLGNRDSPAYRRVRHFIEVNMQRYNLARMIVEQDQAMVQCKNLETAALLLQDAVIRALAAKPAEVRHGLFTWGDDTDNFPYFPLQSRAVCKAVAARCVLIGIPIQQQYEFERDVSVRSVKLSLRTQTKPRPYQVEALEAATTGGTLNSGCLLLPCGAGKTLLGIMIMCKVKKPTLVVCAGSVSVEQWKNQIMEYASFESSLNASTEPNDNMNGSAAPIPDTTRSGASHIACLTGKQKDEITENTDVVITTYSMLVSAHKAHTRRAAQKHAYCNEQGTQEVYRNRKGVQQRNSIKEKLFAPYGLMILDEVHMIPADAFSESLSFVDAKGVIGLTATYVREDKKILDLFHLVGPKLYDVSMETLAAQGYLAKVNCFEVHTPMTREFGIEYMERSAQTTDLQKVGKAFVLVMLAAANPNKMLCVRDLVSRHLDNRSKILVFCDHIMLLYEYGKLLGAPVISGKTQHRERLMIFSDFQRTSKVSVICVSRVGDVSVNLPSANVVIQVSSHGGSRRQEVQRLGRILRPKERTANSKAVEAWFYSIISTDTLEMGHAAHRTAFLVDQGYACRIMSYRPETSASREPKKEGQARGENIENTTARGVANLVKEDVVGDIASIKQESLHDILVRPSRREPHGPALANSRLRGDIEVNTLSFQLQLLSKVVSSWELEYQEMSRKRRHAEAMDNASEGQIGRLQGHGLGDDDVVVVDTETRNYKAIKKEWNSLYKGSEAPFSGKGVNKVLINELIGANDGFVYHEL